MSPSQAAPRTSETTNTIAVTAVPKSFFHPNILSVLRDHLESYGEINQWVPLPGFGRILVVFVSPEAAETAKLECDPIVLRGDHTQAQTILRVYRADANPLLTDNANAQITYLRPPEIEKNFLISPPGSPPVGWEPIKEDPPNAVPLADDLIAALKMLKVRERVEVLMEPGDGGVGVYVEDCDHDEVHDDWVYGESAPARSKWKPMSTAMPPIPVPVPSPCGVGEKQILPFSH